MKYLFCLGVLCLSVHGYGQTKQQDTDRFLAALNNLITHTSSQHWAYETPFTIDSAFHLNGDILTATFAYKTDTSFFRTRYAAPISKITSIDHDVYLMLMFDEKEVLFYEQSGTEDWRLYYRRNYFHIGMVEDEDQLPLKRAIETAWLTAKKWYLK